MCGEDEKKIKSFSHSVMYDSCNLMDCSPLAPLSVEFSRQEYWNGQPFPFPGDLPDPGVEPGSPELQADSLPSEPRGKSKVYSLSKFQVQSIILGIVAFCALDPQDLFIL